MKLLEGLNEQQRAAVVSTCPKILCLAGAGSGKTGTLTRRIAYLNEQRISCGNMLALTFTRLAGKEMKERLIKLIGKREAKKLFCNTFHSFCVNVLRKHGEKIGYSGDFTIYDADDSVAIITTILKEVNYDTTTNDVFAYISNPYSYKDGRIPEEERVYREYKRRLLQFNALDYNMLISYTTKLLEDFPEVAEEYHSLYEYVFVDEFQDTNDEQWKLVNLMRPRNLFVVGDDFQAIYGWRGANIDIILGLASDPEWEVIKLETNYRSTHEIVHAANVLIKNNHQTDKKLIALRDGVPVTYFEVEDEQAEAYRVSATLLGLCKDNYSDFAVLARTNRQLEIFHDVFTTCGIPCHLVNNAKDVFSKPEIRNIIGFLELYCNPKDDYTFRKIVNYPEQRISHIGLAKLAYESTRREKNMLLVLNETEPNNRLNSISKKLEEIETNTEAAVLASASDMFKALIELLGLEELYTKQGRVNRLDDLTELLSRVRSWEREQTSVGEPTLLTHFLKWLKLKDIHTKLEEESNTVKLMTVHAAKGLEFPVVFVVGLNMGIFPSSRSTHAEERRLMYVAITRAKDELYLSRYLEAANYFGKGRSKPTKPSIFIRECMEDTTPVEAGGTAQTNLFSKT